MNAKTSSYRQLSMAIALLFPTLGATAIAEATEQTATFENDLGGWTAILDTSRFDWARHTGGTPSYYTGPAGAYEGEYYLYLEASYGNTPGKVAYLESPNLSEETISAITFHYHLYGDHMGILAVEAFDGQSWNAVWEISGQQQADHASPWTRTRVDLSGQIAEKIRFKGTTGDSYRGDMAIDRVIIETGDGPGLTGQWSRDGDDIHYTHGNVGIGDDASDADLSIRGNFSYVLTGQISMPAGDVNVTGEGTIFTEELRIGDSLQIEEHLSTVVEIHSDTALTVDTPHPDGAQGATAYIDSHLLRVRTGAGEEALLVNHAGNVGIGTAAPKAKLEVAGGIKLGNDTVCDAGKEGTIRYGDTGQGMEICNGAAWTAIGSGEGGQGPEGPEGPQGIQGEQGPEGPQGPPGIAGRDGVDGIDGTNGIDGADGDSAYQVWLEAGNTGTEAEFIASLKGEKGDPGTSGPVVNLTPQAQAPANPADGDLYLDSSGALCIHMDGGWTKIVGNGSCTSTSVVYSNDFSAGAGAEWTDPTTSVANGESFLATASHGSGNGTNSLILSGLPAHTSVTVEFDLYIIRSLDGNGPRGGGADNWQLTVGEGNESQTLLYTNFANVTGSNTQAYPNQLPPYGDGGSFTPRTGAFEANHLGFGTGDWGDATYRLSFTFDHSASDISLNFTSLQNQGAGDEGWGLDNVTVSLTP